MALAMDKALIYERRPEREDELAQQRAANCAFVCCLFQEGEEERVSLYCTLT